MNKLFSNLLLAVAGVLAISSCSDDSGNLTPPTPTEILTRTWRMAEIEVYENGEEVSNTEYLNLSVSFTQDGSIQDGGNYTVDRVTPAFPNTTGTWKWANPEIKRNILLDAGTEDEATLEVTEIQADLIIAEFTREGGVVNGRNSRTIPDRKFVITLRSI